MTRCSEVSPFLVYNRSPRRTPAQVFIIIY
ncbi:unnamed protein product [Lactuca saligna]|uniref:Uncharacterized protein n=1 Tax=Lactuca saligna TaxID=75948 RepID=A0AA35VF71_LACSI|nr:unnamed protein product [Lactuca saligna]